jgi:transposase
MLVQLLLSNPCLLHPLGLLVESERITLVAVTVAPQAACPVCGALSSRVHSCYTRSFADLPCLRIPVHLNLHTRRFFCDAPECPRKIFTERLPEVAAPSARRTVRLIAALHEVAHDVGGELGAHMARSLGMPVSADTLLRHLARHPAAEPATPRVLGVDDWAWCKGQRYGTVLVDLERGEIIDLLPDRQAETLATWLKAHPGVEIITRDRATAYAEGARQGAPDAVQVADRWHLLHNLADALAEVLTREHATLRAAAEPPPPAMTEAGHPAPASAPPHVSVEAPGAWDRRSHREREQSAQARARRVALYEQLLQLRQEGLTARQMAQRLGISHTTASKYLKSGAFPERKTRASPPGSVAPYAAYLRRRWDEGCHNAQQLWRELREQGFPGQPIAVWRFTRRWREGHAGACGATERSPDRSVPAHPAPRAVVWWLIGTRKPLTAEQAAYVERVKQASPPIALAQSLVGEFFDLTRQRQPEKLAGWVDRAIASGIEELTSFCRGLRRDWEAVVAGLTLKWSNGPVEGQVNRLKVLKRGMFGRAGLRLLRARLRPRAEAA